MSTPCRLATCSIASASQVRTASYAAQARKDTQDPGMRIRRQWARRNSPNTRYFGPLARKSSPSKRTPAAFSRKNSPSKLKCSEIWGFLARWANFFAHNPRRRSDVETTDTSACRPSTPSETNDTTTRLPELTNETASTTASPQHPKNQHFPRAKVSPVSSQHSLGPAKVSPVSSLRCSAMPTQVVQCP